jgi:putative copper resistance protein D
LSDPLIYVRAVHFAATLLAAGAVYFVVLVAPRAVIADAENFRRRLAAIAWIGLVVSVISGALWLVLAAQTMSGQPLSELWPQGVIGTVLTQTEFGNAWLLSFIAAVLLAGTFMVLFRAERTPKPWRWIDGASAILATFCVGGLAWAGHAIGGNGIEGILHPAADVLHLVAAAAWLGTLPLLALLFAWSESDTVSLAAVRTATARFSTLGIASVGTLLVTGIVNTWYLAGSVAALTETTYGWLLDVKVALFIGMVAIAAVNRLRLTPLLMRDDGATIAIRALRRNAIVETLAGVIVLCIVAKLGTLPPGSHNHPHYGAVPADAAFVHIHSSDGMADVTIVPGRAGTARATIRLWDENFGALNAKTMTFMLTPPEAGAPPVKHSAAPDADGAWQIGGIELSQPGNWTVQLDAVLGNNKHLKLDAPIVIEPAQ